MGLTFLLRIIYVFTTSGYVPEISVLAFIFAFTSGLQFTLFAMFFDMQYNQDLKGV
jgi:hypothetical protein